MSSIVVLAHGPQGLTAGALLAQAGHSVRVLELSGSSLEDVHPDLVNYGSLESEVEGCTGPAIEKMLGPQWVCDTDDLRPAFQRRSAWLVGLRRRLRSLAEAPMDSRAWLSDHLGDHEQALRIARTALGLERGVPSVTRVRDVMDLTRCWHSGDASGWRRQRVAGAMGEVLEDVDLVEFELLDGRVQSLETDVGREWVDNGLFFDCPIGRVVSALPRPVAESLSVPIRQIRTVHKIQALVQVDRVTLPALMMVDDPGGVWRCRVVRDSVGGLQCVVIDLCFRAEGDVRAEALQRVESFIGRLGSRIDRFGEPRLHIREEDVAGGTYLPVLKILNRIGLFHVHQVRSWILAG